MKKLIIFILSVLCLFIFVGCIAEKDNDKTQVYTFSGENEYISVINGTAVIDGEEEAFSGGELRILNKELFDGAVYWSSEFYILKDGEKRTVYKDAVNDGTGGAEASISGNIGKISGGNVITEYEESDVDDFINNLFYKFTVRNAQGEEMTYELQMDVERVY